MNLFSEKIEKEIHFLNKKYEILNYQKQTKCHEKTKYIMDRFDNLIYLMNNIPTKDLSNLPKEYLENIIELASIINQKDLSLLDKLNEFQKQQIYQYCSLLMGINSSLVDQHLEIRMSPINKKDFTKGSINYKSPKNKEIFGQNLMVNNYHVVELNVTEKSYGLTGSLIFELCYPDRHPDFDFLFDDSLLIYLDIQVSDKFRKKTKEYNWHSKKSRFVAVGQIEKISKQYENINMSNDATVKRFEVSFSDPLKSYWSLHKPNYIDRDKNLNDIFFKDAIFDSKARIFDFDYTKCTVLQPDYNKYGQLFVSTIDRSFYDFFIEQMKNNNCVIKYESNPQMNDNEQFPNPIYYVADNVEQLTQQTTFKEVINYQLKNDAVKFTVEDLINIKEEIISPKDTSYYINKKYQSSNILLISEQDDYQNTHNNEVTKVESISNSYNNDNLYESANDYNSLYKDAKTVKLLTSSQMPYLHSKIDYVKISNGLDDKEVLIGEDNSLKLKGSSIMANDNDYYLKSKTVKIKRPPIQTEFLYKSIVGWFYPINDSVEDQYEKISHWTKSEKMQTLNMVTPHINDISYTLVEYPNSIDKVTPDYPDFKKHKEFNIIGKIIVDTLQIGKVNSEAINRQYKFFKDFELIESSFKEMRQEKSQIYYALEIPCSMFNNPDPKNPVIYIPVDISINSSTNEFLPLRNGDIVNVKVINIEECYADKIISSSTICREEASNVHSQHYLLGSNENFLASYTEVKDDEQDVKKEFLMKQVNKDNDIALTFSDVESGLSMSYVAKKEDS